MKIGIFPDSQSVAREAATLIAEGARAAVSARGKFVMAVRRAWLPALSERSNRPTSGIQGNATPLAQKLALGCQHHRSN
jgi:hypothetical protein